ncbi:MAG: zinc ribbon domain-containing protein [Candidatus Helarchaeota archaeon]
MILDKKIFTICLIYSLLTVFFSIVLFLPFRVVYSFQNFSSYYYFYDFSLEYYLFIPQTVRFVISRGIIPYIIGLILFIISMIFFLRFSIKGTPRLSTIGYILGICSCVALILSIIVDYLVYYGRMMDATALVIIAAICFTEINIGTMIFIKRNDLEHFFPLYIKKDYRPLKVKRIEHLTSIEQKPIFAKVPSKPSELIKEYCPYCGAEVKLDHLFCRKCGKSLKN